jgi:hypothetical protein
LEAGKNPHPAAQSVTSARFKKSASLAKLEFENPQNAFADFLLCRMFA